VSLALFFFLPFATACLLMLWRPAAILSRRIALLASIVMVLWASGIVANCADGELMIYAFGNWSPPFGIVFVVDRLGALFLMLHTLLLFAALVALRPEAHGEETVRRAHPLLMIATFGLFGAFMTGDLFNLFVMIELVLVSSYLLIQVPGTDRSLVAAMPMIVINTCASALFIAGLGILYGIGGSLNIAELIGNIGATPHGLRLAGLGMLVAAFATKAALVPLCFWMPATYPTLTAPVAALFAGIMTKLGVYSLLRISPLLAHEPVLFTTLMWLGGLSALLGVLAALSQYELRRLLSFHSVSQVGYIVFALGLQTVFGIAAAIFFALHHSLVKFTLYLVADELERSSSSRDLRQMSFSRPGGVVLTTAFGLAAFALAGIPPLSGFFGKLAVFWASFESEEWLGLAMLVLASVFTLASMLKIWRFAFQRYPMEERTVHKPVATFYPTAVVIMSVMIIVFSLAAGPIYRYGLDAAEQIFDVGGQSVALLSGVP
jgi:multicomponent Na+:H+ antiporter subunit D